MPKLLFWNIAGGTAASLLQAVCSENEVDLLILAEDKSLPGEVEDLLNPTATGSTFTEHAPATVPNPVRFYTRYPDRLARLSDIPTDRISVRSYTAPAGPNIIIAGAHLRSKLYGGSSDQYLQARRLRLAVEEAEDRLGHQYSIIIGDLNMNPFETGVIAADGLHGVMDKRIALKNGRTVDGSFYRYFYNPMWSRLGDESEGPPGTYHYGPSGVETYFWNTFDQVLLRPTLLPHLAKGNLKVITKVGDKDLLSGSKIDASISDHLPILLNLDLEGATP